jgi:flagellin-like protein
MFEDTADRGQVGIGTLIVFIAMVLVAAIAAGVLVNTAGFLQENAEQTGQQAQGEVSDRIDVVSAYATDSTDNGDYNQVVLTVRKASGSDDISLDDTTYTYLGPDGATASNTLNATSNGAVTTTAVANNDATILRSESDRIEITLDLTTIASALSPGSEFELQITTSSGASTYVQGRVPDTAESGGVVEI